MTASAAAITASGARSAGDPASAAALTVSGEGSEALRRLDFAALDRQVLPDYLRRQRWFAAKSEAIASVSTTPLGSLPGSEALLAFVDVATGGAEEQRYFLPVSMEWDTREAPGLAARPGTLAPLRQGSRSGTLVDAGFDTRFARDLMAAMAEAGDVPVAAGSLRFTATAEFPQIAAAVPIRPVGAEQSNVSLVIGSTALLKIYRRVRPGEQPEIEVARFLTEVAGYGNTPAFLGAMEFIPQSGAAVALASVFRFVPNQGDAWGVLTDALEAYAGDRSGGDAPNGANPADGSAFPLNLPALLGQRTAELHAALATPTDDPAFAAEPIRAEDLGRWADEVTGEVLRGLDQVARLRPSLPGDAAHMAAQLLDGRDAILQRLDAVRRLPPSGLRTRIHGDYHLGQVLVADRDVLIIDFEGEPQRSVEERRAKTSPLRDVAGLLRSFDYAAWAVLDRIQARQGGVAEPVRARVLGWRSAAERKFLQSYWPVADRAGFVPRDRKARDALLDLFLLQKAFYEIGYEAASRPTWLPIPVRGVLGLIEHDEDTP